jgi:Subtilase family
MGAMAIRAGALTLLSLLVLVCETASAEVGAPVPTVQAVAANATWLAYTPPPAQPGIVCMVDSGVDPNPDTEAAVIGGQALSPETDTLDEIATLEPRVQPGNHPDGHGTLMAMTMAAPINGWGMVGIAPTSVRVYNMKALPKGQTSFPFDYYSIAINDCHRLRVDGYPSMTVVNLSLDTDQSPGVEERAGLENYVVAAQQGGLTVVAAAGNNAGAVLYPAADVPIVAVGAGDAGSSPGTLCSFASQGDGLDLIAPGCDSTMDGLEGAFEDDGSPAFGSGSSQASAIVSAVLASIRAYAPQLTYRQAEECLTTTAENRSIDVAAAFDACGLSQIVSEGQAAEQIATASSQQPSAGSNLVATKTASSDVCTATESCQHASSEHPVRFGGGTRMKCPDPLIAGMANRRDGVVLRVRSRQEGCLLQARLRIKHRRRYLWILTKSIPSSTLRLLSHDAGRIEVRFTGRMTSTASSHWVVARL